MRHLPLLLLLVLGLQALAEENQQKQSIFTDADLRGWYAGGGYAITDGYDSPNASDQSDNGYIINAGYRFTNFVAIETGYLQDNNFSSTQLSGIFVLPFLKRWEAYAKLGWSFWEADTAPPGTKDDDDTFIAGAGLGLTVWDHWHFRLEYQAINLRECDYFSPCPGPDPGTFDSFIVELHYRFGSGWK
ncbi:MAG: porin family protein [Gammaproteobacteria bacterium]|nr:porin family protein [Gammaproteobacteria bacterium]